MDERLPAELRALFSRGEVAAVAACDWSMEGRDVFFEVWGHPVLHDDVCIVGFWSGSQDWPTSVRPQQAENDEGDRLMAVARDGLCPTPAQGHYSSTSGLTISRFKEIDRFVRAAVSSRTIITRRTMQGDDPKLAPMRERISFLLDRAAKERVDVPSARKVFDLGLVEFYAVSLVVGDDVADGLGIDMIRLFGGHYIIRNIAPAGS
jgi:hypothetical protein